PKIEQHDMEFKVQAIRRFLEEGHKVRVSVRFRGREQAHPELGRAVLERVFKSLEGAARAEAPATVEGRDMVVTLVPFRTVTRETKSASAQAPSPAASPGAPS
ncbi:MAG: translation initiation factor IF-3, partial [Chloroflexi bacterium]|nr:translation initiation factor IF-3 [Chloroflexota bacterium]